MASLADIRKQYPQYGDMSDQQLADALYAKFYSDMPRDQFDAKLGVKAPLTQQAANASIAPGRGQRVSTNIEMPGQSQLPGPLGQLQNTLNAAQSGAMQGMTFGFDDEINAGLETPLRMVGDVFQGNGFDPGRNYNEALAKFRGMDKRSAALNPTANTVGEITGGLTTGGTLARGGLTLMNGAKSLPGLIARGAAEGAAYGGAYGAGKDEGDLGSKARAAGTNALWGALTGGTFAPLAKLGGDAIDRMAQNRATSAAIKNAPSSADLKAQASQMFKNVDASGVTVNTPRFSQLVNNLASSAKKMGIDPDINPKAWAAYQRVIGALHDVQQTGGSLTISNLHTLRQIAQNAARSAEPGDAMFANRIVDGLDDFMTSPGAMNLPRGAGTQAPNELLKAISTWSRARKVGLIEEAIAKSQTYASGVESGLRNQFGSLLRNKRTAKLWTPVEREAIGRVVNGTAPVAALRTLGIFRGVAAAGLGGAIGGFPGAAALGAAGYLGRKVTSKAAENAAERAARIVGIPNLPQVPPIVWPQIGGAGVPLLQPAYPKN